jgi:rhodanese-related sulfurtransferase
MRTSIKILSVMAVVALVLPALTGCKSCEGGACAISAGEAGKTLNVDGRPGGCGGKACGGCPVSTGGEKAATVSTASLKAMLDAKTPLILLDARTGQYDDGRRIPGAASLSPTASEAEITKVLPAKDALIVTYCSNVKCQASPKLAAALRKLGYTNVIEYSAGIAGWTEAGFEVKETGK